VKNAWYSIHPEEDDDGVACVVTVVEPTMNVKVPG